MYREFTEKELKWIKSFQNIMKKAPNTLFFFVGAGKTIFPKDKNNEVYMKGYGVDPNCPGILIDTPMECDGGDY